eukprot:gnl/Chilomastix_cuspidata/34.p2 GENE.gnl/Chilomastix_cuspidata/34~~gnl/Chilomastix_cuspidata/34.p2  ORF type:complete len:481 (+),score=189.62 gnl/Chilomastix_cuspidata/34:3812-5254(+)
MEEPAAKKFTCLGCALTFDSLEAQHEHFQSEHHIYNMRRKVIGMNPVSLEEFLVLQREKMKEAEQTKRKERSHFYCEACEKRFSKESAYNQHCRTKSHRTRAAERGIDADIPKVVKRKGNQKKRVRAVNPKAPPRRTAEVPLPHAREPELDTRLTLEDTGHSPEELAAWDEIQRMLDDGEIGVEQVDDVVWDLILSKRRRFAPDECFLCNAATGGFDALLVHLEREHGFTIPDAAFCVDPCGLMQYLSEKVAVGRQCLRCNRTFTTLGGCQDHMRGTAHGRIRYQDYDEELGEFYDFTPMWETAAREAAAAARGPKRGGIPLAVRALRALLAGPSDAAEEEEEAEDVNAATGLPAAFVRHTRFVPSSSAGMAVSGVSLHPGTGELVLPSGRIIGHRAYRRVYRQHQPALRRLAEASTDVRLCRQETALMRSRAADTRVAPAALERQQRVMYADRAKRRIAPLLTAHKLMKHFRRQDIMFG